jgi:hypothetical protein
MQRLDSGISRANWPVASESAGERQSRFPFGAR